MTARNWCVPCARSSASRSWTPFGMMPYAAMDSISMDPVDPMGVRQHSEMLGDLSPEAIQTLVEVAGAGSGSPLIVLEIRQLGGALARDAEHLSTMGKGDSNSS